MQLTINGEARQYDAPASLSSLIETLGLDPRKLASAIRAKRL